MKSRGQRRAGEANRFRRWTRLAWRGQIVASTVPVFYDCEASSLDGVPIEIGWAFADGSNWCNHIRGSSSPAAAATLIRVNIDGG